LTAIAFGAIGASIFFPPFFPAKLLTAVTLATLLASFGLRAKWQSVTLEGVVRVLLLLCGCMLLVAGVHVAGCRLPVAAVDVASC